MDSKQIILSTDSKLAEELQEQKELLNDALAAAREGDPAELNRLYDRAPTLIQVLGKAMLEAEQDILGWWKGLGKGPKLYLDELRESLGYANAGGLERLLIDRIMICWLRAQQADHMRTERDREGVTLPVSRYYDRRLEVANKSLNRACLTLARIQRLLAREPTAQINILAQQQVNIASESDRSITD